MGQALHETGVRGGERVMMLDDAPAYEAETEGVRIRVRPVYLADQSDPEAGRWIWAYAVEIENRRPRPVQLLARRWTITGADGHGEEVRGPGVVGEQPAIGPGETDAYAAGRARGAPSG